LDVGDGEQDPKVQFIKKLHERQVDFRLMKQMKLQLHELCKYSKVNTVSFEDYQRVRHFLFKDPNQLGDLDTELLPLIKSQDGGKIDVTKFGEIIDLYVYFPMRIKKDKNKSDEVYYQMLSSQKKS
jgi:hypothetical protein